MSSRIRPYNRGFEWRVQECCCRVAPALRFIASIFAATVFLSTTTPSGWGASSDDIELLQRNRSRMAVIISKVARPDGQVNKAVHAEFWALFPPSVRDNPRTYLENLDVLRGMTFQKELWESIRLSARARRPVKTLSYESSKAKALAADESGRDAARRAEEMITAAARGTPLQHPTGSIVLDEQTANKVLDGLNDSLERLERLLNPIWKEQ